MLHRILPTLAFLYQTVLQSTCSWNCAHASQPCADSLLCWGLGSHIRTRVQIHNSWQSNCSLGCPWCVQNKGRPVVWGADCMRMWIWERISWTSRSASVAFQDLVVCSVQAGAEPAKNKYFLLMHHVDRDFCTARGLSPAPRSCLMSTLYSQGHFSCKI